MASWTRRSGVSGRRGAPLVAATAAAAALAVLAAAGAAEAGVVVLDRHVEVGAQAGARVDDVLTEESDAETAPPEGPFDVSAEASVQNEQFNVVSAATLSADFDSVQDGFRVSGRLRQLTDDLDTTDDEIDAGGTAAYEYSVNFELDRDYTFNFVSEGTDVSLGRDVFSGSGAILEGGTGPDAVSLLDGSITSGILRAGTYKFGQGAFVSNDPSFVANEVDYTLDFSFHLQLEEIDDGGGGETPIPLPQAVWAGLSVMGLGLLNRWRKSLLRA